MSWDASNRSLVWSVLLLFVPNVKNAGGCGGLNCSWRRRLKEEELDCRTRRGNSFQRRVALGMKEFENKAILLGAVVSVCEFRKFLPVCDARESGRIEFIYEGICVRCV